jgi:hypothetical protein
MPGGILSTIGAPTGNLEVQALCAGSSNPIFIEVTIEVPTAPPAPRAQSLCALDFSRDNKRPTRVDNEALACLDEIALDLQRQSDATLVLVGEAEIIESHEAAARRAVNAKDYLVKDRGIDPILIMVRTEKKPGKIVSAYLVPAGANFEADVPETVPVDESVIKPIPRNPHRKTSK